MAVFSILAAAIAPGIALLAFFYLRDRYETEPVHMVVRVFLFGSFIVLPIMVVQRGLLLGLGSHPALSAFLISSAVEEFMKWFVLYHIIYNHLEFDEPYDGIVYAVAVSLGFATVENIFYAWFEQLSLSTLFVRALLPVSGHALFGVIMGYYMGKAKFSSASQKKFLAMSLAYPIFWHGVFNFIMTGWLTYWIGWIVPLMALLWIRGLRKVDQANSSSPFSTVRVSGED